MKRYVFPYSVSFGKMDSVDGSFSHALSDENAERLIRSAEEGDRHKLSDDPFISDIFVDVDKALMKKLVKQLLQDPAPVRASLSWKDSYDPSAPIGEKQVREYLDDLMITVYYPKKLQLLDTKRPAASDKANYVIMNDEDAARAEKEDSYGNNMVILTDEGRTLFHVPLKFAGSVTVPASVRRIRQGYSKGAFLERKNVTEVIIEEGLEDIEEFTFRGCSGLKHVSIPGTVRKIGHLAFHRCFSLEKVDLAEGLEEIYYSSFDSCSALKSLVAPASLKVMYKLNIRDIYFMGKDTEITDKLGCNWGLTTLHVLPGSVAEKYAVEHNIKYVVMQDGVK